MSCRLKYFKKDDDVKFLLITKDMCNSVWLIVADIRFELLNIQIKWFLFDAYSIVQHILTLK